MCWLWGCTVSGDWRSVCGCLQCAPISAQWALDTTVNYVHCSNFTNNNYLKTIASFRPNFVLMQHLEMGPLNLFAHNNYSGMRPWWLSIGKTSLKVRWYTLPQWPQPALVRVESSFSLNVGKQERKNILMSQTYCNKKTLSSKLTFWKKGL